MFRRRVQVHRDERGRRVPGALEHRHLRWAVRADVQLDAPRPRGDGPAPAAAGPGGGVCGGRADRGHWAVRGRWHGLRQGVLQRPEHPRHTRGVGATRSVPPSPPARQATADLVKWRREEGTLTLTPAIEHSESEHREHDLAH